MKTATKAFILFFLFLVSHSNLKAQLLNNTRWRSYGEQNNFDNYWNFNNDTVATSPDNATWTKVAVYIENGNVLSFRDLDSLNCNLNDVGIYHFSIVLDTLRIVEFQNQDPCVIRSEYFSSHYFVDFPIGVKEIEYFKNLQIYPLPFSDELNIKTDGGGFDFFLLDVTSRKVIASSFHDNLKLDTETLEPGTYTYEIRDKEGRIKSGTLVKR